MPVEVVLCLIRALSDEAAAVAAAAAATAALGLPELLQLAVTDERPQVRATAVLGIGALRREARSRMPPGLATLAPLAAALAAGGASDESMRGLVDAAARVLKPLRCAPPLKVAPLIRALPRAGGPARGLKPGRIGTRADWWADWRASNVGLKSSDPSGTGL